MTLRWIDTAIDTDWFEGFTSNLTNKTYKTNILYKVIKEEDYYQIKMIIPELSKDDINISIDNDEILIEYEIKSKEEKVLYDNITGKYNIKFELKNADFNKIDAIYKNNILLITIPFRVNNKIKIKGE